LPFSENEVTTHWKAIGQIAVKVGREKEYVFAVLYAYFGKWGLKWFIEHKRKIRIRNFGVFYFHKNSVKAYKRMKNKSITKDHHSIK
jgi:hypothetical protein